MQTPRFRLRLFVVLAVSALSTLSRAAAAEEDAWFGRDKALHFGVSVALGGGGYALSAPVLDERWQRAAAGSAFSLSIGAAKELYDLSGAGNASYKDFAWDVAGTVVGVGIAWLIDLALSPSTTPARQAPLDPVPVAR